MKFIFLCFLFAVSLFSQQIQVEVKIQAQRLTGFQKDEIRFLKSAIENYINDYDWVETDSDDILDVNFSIIIETVTEVNGANQYKAQFLCSSPGQENYYDKTFNFEFKPTEELRHHEASFHPLTGFLDFYVSMILAGELDGYSEFGGEEQYAKAREALIKAQSSSYASDWTYRERIFLDSTSPFVRSLRKAKLNYWIAKAEYDDGNLKEARRVLREEIMENIREAFRNQPNNTLYKRFFEGYYKWIVELVDPVQDQQILKDLINYDPVRKDYYKKFMERN